MAKRIVLLLVLIAILYVGFRMYQSHQQTLKVASGDFSCQGCDSPEEHERFLKENSGDTPDGNSEHKMDSARVAAEKAAAGDTAATTTPTTAPNSTGSSSMVSPDQPTVYPPAAPPAASNAPVVVPTTGQPGAMPAGLPTQDSESPNAPNGMRFAGSGAYQWYRQGNLTWRVDTTTGRSCIIYATIEEWRKQIVMSHGCGRDA
jgi:hypothetical protein